MKKIVLIASASNFEGHKQIVTSVIKTMQKLGGYTLDVLTSYGRYASETTEFEQAEKSVYEILEKRHYDGAILENNIGSTDMLYKFEKILKRKNVPYVAVNSDVLDCPSFCQNSFDTVKMLIEHMITEHNSRKINLVLMDKNSTQGQMAYSAYVSTLSFYGIEVDEDRVFEQIVGLDHGSRLFDEFKARKKDDVDTVISFHEVNAIGLIQRYMQEGVRVPDDVRIASLHYTVNSMVYRPDITGIVVEDERNAREAMLALDRIINGGHVRKKNFSSARIQYGRSCGCENKREEFFDYNNYQNVIMSKISMASQIKAMMEYNQSLKNIDSLEKYGKSIEKMLLDIGCENYCICVNSRDMDYLYSKLDKKIEDDCYLDDRMFIVSCKDEETEWVESREVDTADLIPFEAKEGDYHIVMPLHCQKDVYGYVVIKNSLLPVTVYNYRICHESIGNSLEDLRNQLNLHGIIDELERIKYIDHMTGTYNKAGLAHFRKLFLEKEKSVVAIMDVDKLKEINDVYGHVQGDVAIRITADAIVNSVENDDIVIRYGGDEFLVLSKHLEEEKWKCYGKKINDKIERYIHQRNIEYSFGISFGYAYYEPEVENPDSVIDLADKRMYENKRKRKEGNTR